MKRLKRTAAAVLVFFLMLQLTGCALISVDPDRDNAQVIATLDGQDIYKSQFNNYMAYLEMQYKMSSQSMPTGSSLKTLKENLYDALIQQDALAMKADKDGVTVDEDSITKTAEETYDSLKDSLGEGFTNILDSNYVTEDMFKDWIVQFQIDSSKASKVLEDYLDEVKKDPSMVLDQVVGKIGDEDVTRGEYDYYYIDQSLTASLSGSSTSDTDELNETIFNEIELNRANIAYCEENDIHISQTETKNQVESLDSTLSYMGLTGDTLTSTLESFYMTEDEYKDYQEQAAKAAAAKQAIKQAEEDKITVTDDEVEKYYEDNKDSYDESTVSAMHILTSDENIAKDIYEKAKDTDKAGFEKLMDEYKDDDTVLEATDLGAFTRSTMVEEFSDAAFDADVNTVVGPVLTSYGYHVIYVYDKDDKGVKSLDDVKDEIVSTLKEDDATTAYNKIEDELAKKYKVDIYDFSDVTTEYAQQVEEELGLVEYKSRVGI